MLTLGKGRPSSVCQFSISFKWLTEVLTKMAIENREIVMLGISIETKELCCRDSKDCLLYRIYLYVLDNTAILSECSPFREAPRGVINKWLSEVQREIYTFHMCVCMCRVGCSKFLKRNRNDAWIFAIVSEHWEKNVLITNKTAQEKLKY